MHARLPAASMLCMLALTGAAPAADVAVALVTGPEGRAASLEEKQALWKSPFGGWVVAAWPFSVRVDDTEVFVYRTPQERLMAEALSGAAKLGEELGDEFIDGLAEELADQREEVRPEDLKTFRLDRKAAATLRLGEGRHVVRPFGIEFTVAEDGALTSRDPRVRIDGRNARVEVVCHPVVVKTFRGRRSTHGPLNVACGSTSLLGGLDKVIAAFTEKDKAAANVNKAGGFRRLTLYLPASVPGRAYRVNGARFDVDGGGRVALAADARALCPDGREIRLQVPAAEPVATRPLGVRWSGAEDDFTIACGKESVAAGAGAGSTWLPVPATGAHTVELGKLSVRLPTPDPRRPHAFLLWDAAASACRAVETSPLASRPGGEWSCRVTSLVGRMDRLPAPPTVRLEALHGDEAAGEVALRSRGEGVYAGILPRAPGLWRLACGPGSPLSGRPLGLVRIDADACDTAVSLFTWRNRGVYRRGDRVDLFWIARGEAGAPPREAPVVLRGRGLEAEIATVAAANRASGCLRLDTSALAPGTYEAGVQGEGEGEGVASFPARFRICQREPRSDFEIYSHTFNNAEPHGGSPVAAYYGGVPDAPGLGPFLADADASLDPVFAAYADSPAGPALEKFRRPSAEEATLMSLAGLGMRAVPAYPPMLHHEDWNPKHTLPEELARMRRRLALFVQPRADVAGLGGIALGWYATLGGYWEEAPRQDGHQARRNAEAGKWVAARVAEEMEKYAGAKLGDAQRKRQAEWAGVRARSSILPNAFEKYLADARRMVPGLTAHNAIPNFWQGRGGSYAPAAYATLTRRDAVDYTDYCLPPWGNFRAPAFLDMGNPNGQRLQCEYFTHDARAEQIPVAFGAAGRGLDGISLNSGHEALLRVLERFGPWFSSMEPLRDVAVYFSGWPQRASVILHDLARMRRPGMLLAPEDVLAGSLEEYNVLFLAGVGAGEAPDILDAFRAFEARGGAVIKDGACHADLPGRPLGFAYDRTHVHNGWGLAYPDGEWEFAHLWKNFKETRETHLVEAFAGTPGVPVTTPDADVVIAPLAGAESILCFVINQTLAPLDIPGRWRQQVVLPRIGELLVEDGWHVRDVLTARPVEPERTPRGRRVAVDFTRAEGAIYLLTRRGPAAMAMRTARVAPGTVRLTAWLADAGDRPLPDPMPFEVTLKGPGGAAFFRKFAALGPARALEVPVPALARGTRLELVVRDLILGCTAAQRLEPAAASLVTARADGDFVGGVEHAAAFLSRRNGPVTVLLDEGQDAFRPAADELAAVMRGLGRDAGVVAWDPAEVRPLPLRWKPLAGDLRIIESLRDGRHFASRVGLRNVGKEDKRGRKSVDFGDPACGYDEYGPRLRVDADVVLFGTPGTHRAVAELEPYLRRVPTDGYPAPGRFFVHCLWSPFKGGCDGLYVGCRDPLGAASAVRRLAEVARDAGGRRAGPAAPAADAEGGPLVTRGGPPAPLENMIVGKFGTRILDAEYSPSGRRLFVTTNSYGDWLFTLSPSGEIRDRRMPLPGGGFNCWWRHARGLRPVDDSSMYLSLWDATYLYDLERGWIGRAVRPPTGFTGRYSAVKVAASTVLEDAARDRAYLGGRRKLRALDGRGRLLWTYDDATVRTSIGDILYPRCLFPRAASGDGRVLLVAGFGIKHDCYGLGKAVNASTVGLDAATGATLWQRDGLLLNRGKAIPLEKSFLVIDDAGQARVTGAADGEDAGSLRPVGGSDWILAVPGREELLVVENNRFDRKGPTSRAYIRPVGGGPDRTLAVDGRVTDVAVDPDGESVTFVTERGATQRFDAEGNQLWRAETPPGGIVRPSPDGRAVLVGARDGVLHWLDARSGAPVRTVDFNPFNVTTGADLVRRHRTAAAEIPDDTGFTVPPEPPEPSYRASLDPERVAFGPDLVPEERLREALRPGAPADGDPASPDPVGRLAPDASFTFRVEKGRTYLVELLAAAAEAGKLTKQTRLEISVVGGRRTANLPFVGRLPLGRFLARRRAAFRADEAGEVTLRLRAVEPGAPDAPAGGRKPQKTYERSEASDAGLLVAEVTVAAVDFHGRNLVYEGGAGAASRPAGDVSCKVKPWNGGNHQIRGEPYPCPKTELRLVDGVIANQETAWTNEARGERVEYADAVVRFRKPETVGAIAVYEDGSGPVPAGDGVRERTATRYGVYVREAASGKWRRAGFVDDNTQLVNIFACPDVAVDRVLYYWAGRNDAGWTEGFVRTAEIEVYSADDLSGILDEIEGVE